MTKATVPAQQPTNPVIDVGSWVKRTAEHTIEHLVTGINANRMLISACGERIPKEPAVIGSSSADSPYRCVKCGEAERLNGHFEAIVIS
jgi:hypothetical protein